jgi:hypothetical protein
MHSRQQALNKLSIDWCLPMSFSGEKQNDIGHASWQFDGMFGVMCLTQLNCVIASFKHMQVVWFCLVSNMFCDMTFISTNRVDHLFRMFLSCCKDFSEHSKEACCDPFFAARSNIFSLFNCPVTIKKYGS